MAIITCPKCGAKNRVEERVEMEAVCGRCGTRLEAGGAGVGRPVELSDATFDETIQAAGNKPVLVDCWAAWCGPCRMIAPAIEELAREAKGRYVVGKLDVDRNAGVAHRYQISSIPTMLLFKNGQLADRVVGLQPKAALAARLQQLV